MEIEIISLTNGQHSRSRLSHVYMRVILPNPARSRWLVKSSDQEGRTQKALTGGGYAFGPLPRPLSFFATTATSNSNFPPDVELSPGELAGPKVPDEGFQRPK